MPIVTANQSRIVEQPVVANCSLPVDVNAHHFRDHVAGVVDALDNINILNRSFCLPYLFPHSGRLLVCHIWSMVLLISSCI